MSLKTGLQCSLVVERKKYHIRSFIYRSNNRFVVRNGHCQRCSAMKRFLEGDYFFLSIMKRGEFNRIFIGFSTAVTKEKLIIFFPPCFAQFGRQFFLGGYFN